jgi:glutamyl/glutaminyl-tRNA synthetase
LKKLNEYEFQKINNPTEIKNILKEYIENYYNHDDDKELWFNKMKDLSEKFGYAREVKEYKANPDNYKGHVGDISTVIRVALTTRHNTPDLYEIMQILGKDNVTKRIEQFIKQ